MKHNKVAKLNFTGRHRIYQDSFSLVLDEGEYGDVVLKHTLDGISISRTDADDRVLASDDPLLKDARLVVEVTRRMYCKRFDFGTPVHLNEPDSLKVDLDTLDRARARARLMIVERTCDNGTPPRILAEADRIPLTGKGSLLPIVSDRFEKQRTHLPYKLDFPDPNDVEGRVVLVLNRDLGESRVVARSTAFRGLLLPSIVEEILRSILFSMDQYPEIAQNPSWGADWVKLGERWAGLTVPDSTESDLNGASDWIESAKAGFCRGDIYKEAFDKLNTIWAERGVSE